MMLILELSKELNIVFILIQTLFRNEELKLALWRWTALDEQGKPMKGIWEESKKSFVVGRLREQKLYPLKVQRDFLHSWLFRFSAAKSKLYWSRTSQKIGSMLEAGIPLLTVLEIISDKENDSQRQRGWQKVYQSVRDGNELGPSIKGINPPLGHHWEALIIVGERSGTLARSFLEIASQLDEEYHFEQKIKTALFYPVLLLGIAIIVVYTLSVVVLPIYADLFSSLDAELPFITVLVFTIGSLIPYILTVLLALTGVIFFFKRNYQRRSRNSYLNWLPGIGQIKKYQDIILFCSILETLLNAGMPLIQTLNLLEEAVRGWDMKKLISDLRFEVSEGKRLAPIFRVNSFFPEEAAKMVGVAEESGRLSEMFGYMANMFRKELDQKVQQYTKLLEPLLVIGLAGIVGLVAVGILLPLLDMSTHIR